MKINRKEFFRTAAAGIAVTTLPGGFDPSGKRKEPEIPKAPEVERFREKGRKIPLDSSTDVVVCGGGPAGFAAAVAAARTGATVRLFEVHGCLGGVWTAGMLTWLYDFDKPGIAAEITRDLERRGARRGTNIKQYVYETEEMKLLLEEKCLEAGVKFQLFTRVAGAYKNKDNRLSVVVTESKSGRKAWGAKVFIDATGDGDLGVLAGNGWDFGYKETGITQPMTYMSLISVRDPDLLSDCISFYQGDSRHSKKHRSFHAEISRAGMTPSYGHPTLFQVRDNIIALMINHEYGVDPFDAAQMTEATVRGRAEVNRIVRALRKLGGRWEGIQLVASCEQIGIREGRRIHGLYTVTESDLITGIRHQDAIARVTFGIDIHAATPGNNQKQTISNTTDKGLRAKPYDIPLRALIAKDVDGLLMAGRCISGDFIAHASYRVTGNAVAMGQAAGTLGALSAIQNKFPHQVSWNDVEKALTEVYEHH